MDRKIVSRHTDMVQYQHVPAKFEVLSTDMVQYQLP